MSNEYTFLNADIEIKFENKNDMETRINNFNKALKEHNEAVESGDAECNIYASVVQSETDKKNLVASIEFDEGNTWYDIDNFIYYVCKHFPNSNGFIGWAIAEESSGGYVRYANGGTIKIANGNQVPSEYEQLSKAKKDILVLIDYIKNSLGGNISEDKIKGIINQYTVGK